MQTSIKEYNACILTKKFLIKSINTIACSYICKGKEFHNLVADGKKEYPYELHAATLQMLKMVFVPMSMVYRSSYLSRVKL